VLERTPDHLAKSVDAGRLDESGVLPPKGGGPRRPASLLRQAWQFFTTQVFSSLTRRIVFLNLTGLIALVIGILYLSQFRAGLIDARIQSLLVQGEIIAGAIAASASIDPDSITIDPERLLDLQTGESYDPTDDPVYGLDFSINPERVAPVLRRLVSPTNTRARIYDRDGAPILDSRNLYDVVRLDLPAPQEQRPNYFQRRWMAFRRWLAKGDLPIYREFGLANGKGYEEVAHALLGLNSSMVRINDRGEVIVSVAVPVQRFRAVRGALMLQTQGADIDNMVAAERLAILKVFLVAASVMVVLSFLLAGTIAGPVRRLAYGAERVRHRIRARVELPDFSRRRDEIGYLSRAIRDMTHALYHRIEAIESFAADVAHELKNPLTSLRSAIEVAARPDLEPDRRARLMAIVVQDIERLNRLISDISDASRLDAELMRGEFKTVDIKTLLSDMVQHYATIVAQKAGVEVELRLSANPPYEGLGHDGRYGQVFCNIIDNALSFSPKGSRILVELSREPRNGPFVVTIDDEGGGIPEDNLESIFQRFYSERPTEHFGQHSGLGLSICRQIMETYGGSISASNRRAPDGRTLGARFTVHVPAAS